LTHLKEIITEAITDVLRACAELPVHHRGIDQKEWMYIPDVDGYQNIFLHVTPSSEVGMRRIKSLTKKHVVFRDLSYVWVNRRNLDILRTHWDKWIMFAVADAAFTLHVTLSSGIEIENRDDLLPVMRAYLGICCDASYRFHTKYSPPHLVNLVADKSLVRAKIGKGSYGVVFNSGLSDDQVVKLPLEPPRQGAPDTLYEEARIGFIAGEAGISPKVFDLTLVQWQPGSLPRDGIYDELQNVRQALVVHMEKLRNILTLEHPLNVYNLTKGSRRLATIVGMIHHFTVCSFLSYPAR